MAAQDQFEINVNPAEQGYKRTPLSEVRVLVDGQTTAQRLGAALVQSGSGSGLVGFNTTATVGQSRIGVTFIGGVLNISGAPVLVANDTFNLFDNVINYVEVPASGVWRNSTSGFGIGSAAYPVAKITVSGGLITDIFVERPFAAVIPTGAGAGTVTSVATGTGLTGGPITNSGTVSLNNTAVTPATYGDSTHVGQFTVDQQGRITAAANVAVSGGGSGGSLPNALGLSSEIVPTDLVGTWVAAQGILNAGNPIFGSISASPRATIQAAIDYAWANSIMFVRIPGTRATNYVLDGPLFIDPPLNLRNGLSLAQQKAGLVAAPSIFFDRTMTIYIDPGVIFSHNGSPAWDTAPTIWVGTHNRIQIINGALNGPINPSGSYPAGYARNHPILCCGVAIASGNGGAIATSLIKMDIKNYYNGISWGSNGPSALAEGTQVTHCRVNQCYNCYKWYNGQSFPNWFKDCTNSAAGVIFNNNGQDLIVEGGEMGNFEPFVSTRTGAAGFISALVPFTDSVVGSGFTFTNYKINVQFAGDDGTFAPCPDGGFIYYAGCIALPSFGLIPIEQVAFNSSTLVGTYRICPEWTWMYYQGSGVALDTDTDINTELAAATVYYAAERAVVSSGTIRMKDTHLEFESGVFALKDEIMNGWPNNPNSVFDSIKFGHAIVGSSSDFPMDVVSRSWRWIGQGLAQFEFRNIEPGAASGPISKSPVIVGNTIQNNVNTNSMRWFGGSMLNPNLRLFGQTGNPPTSGVVGYDDTLTSLSFLGSKAGGFGWWERNPFSPRIQTNSDIAYYLRTAGGTSNISFTGYRPSPNELLRLTTSDLGFLINGGGPISGISLCGGRMAVVSDLSLSQPVAFVIDKGGNFDCWETNLSINWNCKGGSHYINITGGSSRNYLKLGLEIIITTDVTLKYIVNLVDFDGTNITGIGVCREDNTNRNISGVKTISYTGTAINQRARQFSFPGQVRSKYATVDFNTTTNGALTPIPNLTHNCFAGFQYEFEVELSTTSNVAAGVQAAIGGTATFSSIEYYGYNQVTSTMALAGGAEATALNTAVGAVTAVTVSRIIIKGTAVCSVKGTMTVTAGQNAANAAASVVKLGSSFDIWETH